LLDVPTIEGTIVEKRIEEACAQGTSDKTVYKLKSDSENLSRNAGMYSEQNMKVLTDKLGDYIHFFGYTAQGENGTPETNFFKAQASDDMFSGDQA
jgi:hypothetical protein